MQNIEIGQSEVRLVACGTFMFIDRYRIDIALQRSLQRSDKSEGKYDQTQQSNARIMIHLLAFSASRRISLSATGRRARYPIRNGRSRRCATLANCTRCSVFWPAGATEQGERARESLQSLLFQTRFCTLFVTIARRLCKLCERCDKVTWSNAAYIYTGWVYTSCYSLDPGTGEMERERKEEPREREREREKDLQAPWACLTLLAAM